jgi:hypothetical protein
VWVEIPLDGSTVDSVEVDADSDALIAAFGDDFDEDAGEGSSAGSSATGSAAAA